MRLPNYIDSGEYMINTPYMSLAKKGSGNRFVEYQLERVKGYEKFIELYPTVKCEPLEFLYQTHRTICAMDKLLFEDLAFHCWRSISWAAWIALVTPYPQKYMFKILKSESNEQIQNQWAVREAIKRLKKFRKPVELDNNIHDFREHLKKLPFKKIPLRRFSFEQYQRNEIKLKEKLRYIYTEKGTNEAIRFLRTRALSETEVTYNEWLRKMIENV